MTWRGLPKSAPAGFELAVVTARDSLAGFAEMLAKRDRIDFSKAARVIAAGNGVDDPGSRSCAWGQDVGDWVEQTGGRIDGSVVNKCDPRGMPRFVDGQRVYLPIGLGRPASTPPIVPPAPSTSAGLFSSPWAKAAGVVGVGLVLRRVLRGSK